LIGRPGRAIFAAMPKVKPKVNAAAVIFGLALAAAPVRAAGPPPLAVRYEAFAAGFPVVSFDFRVAESEEGYALDGQVRTEGLLRIFYKLVMKTDTEGVIAAHELHPHQHEQHVEARGKQRVARLSYPGDGTVATLLEPPEDPGRPKPTPQQTERTIDPLTALLAIGRAVARTGRCAGTFAVFDGRRRYDLVLHDEGTERIEKVGGMPYAGEVRRCPVSAVKIAGFSFDQDYSPHTTNGTVWFATPQPGGPALPVRIEFDSSWGFITVRLTGIE
jgi:hypothetical protein